jgi:hypothetical protein
MFGTDAPVQFFYRVVVLVYGFLAWSVDVMMGVFVGMGVLVGVGMHDAVRVPVLVAVDVRMDVRVRVVVLDLTYHRVLP